jgi:hypothetical protein
VSLDPGKIMADVDKGADRLEAAADTYSKAVLRYEKAENDYERAVQKQLLVVLDKSKKAGERVPAEDLRRAMAHDAIDPEVYAEYLEARAHKESLSVRFRALSASVSARQSLLKSLSGMGG